MNIFRQGLTCAVICVLVIIGWMPAAVAELPPAPETEVEPSQEAREQFQVGVDLLLDPDGARYEEAYRAFYRAYEMSPSWKILGNLGLSAFKIERYTDAIPAYERYLEAAGGELDPKERKQVMRDLKVMKASSGKVMLTTTSGAPATIEDIRSRAVGGPVVNAYELEEGGRLELLLAAGRHTLTATSGGKTASIELEVEPGQVYEEVLELAAKQVAPSPGAASGGLTTDAGAARGSSLRTTGVIVGAVGVAALIGGGVTAFLGVGQRGDLEDDCPDNRCVYDSAEERSQFQSDKDSLETLGLATTVLLIGGGALTATGATLFLVGAPDDSGPHVAVSPTWSFAGGGLTATGSF